MKKKTEEKEAEKIVLFGSFDRAWQAQNWINEKIEEGYILAAIKCAIPGHMVLMEIPTFDSSGTKRLRHKAELM